MKKPKLYFATKDSAMCYSLAFHILFEPKGIKIIELYEAVPYKVSGQFWCNEYQAPTDADEHTCGKSCEGYKPRNGKSGMCTHRSNTFYEPGKLVKIPLK